MLSVALQHISSVGTISYPSFYWACSPGAPDDAVRLPFLPSNLTAFQRVDQPDEWMHVLGVTQNWRPPLHLCFCRWLLVGFHHGGGWGLTQLPFKSPQQLSSLCLYQARTCSEAQFASPGLRLGSGSLDLHPPFLEWICLRNDLYLWLWFCLEGQSCNRAPHTLNTLWSWPRQSASVGLSFGSGQVAQVLCPRVPYHCKAGMGLTCPGLCLRGYSTRRM